MARAEAVGTARTAAAGAQDIGQGSSPRVGTAGTAAPSTPPAGRAWRRRSGAWWQWLRAFCLYQALALAAWWHLLAGGIGSALPTGSADPGEEVWFLAWVPHALGAGTNPFFSHALFAPTGVNLLSNTSVELLGLLLSPVTVTAGPVAALDVAVVLAPALSALGAFALCRRFVRWRPAAFVGGLCYGFGPFVASDLRFAHVDLTWLVLPPLIFLALDELLVRRRHRAWRTGAVLGLLVVAQFFVSTEMLAITALLAAMAVVVAAVAWPRSFLPAVRTGGPGIAVAVLVAGAALAYPVWVVVAGPRHITGAVWPHIGQISATLGATVEPHAQLRGVAFISGGNGSYLGVPLLAVLAAGAVVLWRSTTLRVALGLAAIAYVASLGYDLHIGTVRSHVPLPAALLGHLPLLDSVIPERFGAMVDLFAGLALAVIVDHVRRWERPPPRAGGSRHAAIGRGAARGHASVLTLLLAGAVAAFALVPLAVAPRWPYRTTAVHVPAVFATFARRGEKAQPVVAVFPSSPDASAGEMVAQADDGFDFSLPNGYAIVPGPAGRAVEAPGPDALWLVFAAASLHRLDLPLTSTTRRAVRAGLVTMGVRDVVVLPHWTGSGVVRRGLGSVLGPPTRRVGGAAVWTVRH